MTGLIGRKVGMTQFYNAEGNVIPVTVIQTGPCVVVQKKESRQRWLQRAASGLWQQEDSAGQQSEQGPHGQGRERRFRSLEGISS